MKLVHPGYGDEPVIVDDLQTALFEAVAEAEGEQPEEVAELLFGLNGVPSDDFLSAFDNEVYGLARLFRETQRQRERQP